MRPNSAARIAAALAAAAFWPAAALADGPDDEAGAGQWGVGVGVMSKLRPWRDTGGKTQALPILSYENRWVRIFGPGVDLKALRKGPVSFELTARWAPDGYKPGDSPFLAGMERRKDTVWLGTRAVLSSEIGLFSAEWSADVAGHSKGQRLKLGAERRYAFGDLGVVPRITATWHDTSYVRYYYGVRDSEARTGRPAYAPGGAVNAEVGVRLAYRLGGPHLALADLGVTMLGSSIKDSPIVERSTVPEARLAYVYQF